MLKAIDGTEKERQLKPREIFKLVEDGLSRVELEQPAQSVGLAVFAVVMVLADLFARVVLAPVELPVGIITALAGGPVFVWLLVRSRRAKA